MHRDDAIRESSISRPPEPQPAVTSSNGTGYVSFWKIWVPVAAIFVLLDATFNLYFWRIPKLSKANADYGYQFMVDALPVWQGGTPGSERIVAIGSSVALSFDPRQVQSLLEAEHPGRKFDVHRLLLPGAHPTEYLLYFDDREMRQAPDAVVLLLNLVDFLYPNTERDVNPTLRYILSPWRLLAQRYDRMSISGALDSLLSGSSRLYRYRRLIRSSVQDHVRAAGRWLRSRPPASPYGVFADGYAQQSFAVPVAPASPTTVKYFIDPEWIRQRGQVRLEFSAGGETLATRTEDDAGWKTVEVEVDPKAGLLEIRADSVWTPRAADGRGDPRLRSVRLADPPAVPDAPANEGFRYRLWTAGELDNFLRMGGKTGEEFERAWETTLKAKTRFGRRFRVYRDAKLELCQEPFDAGAEYEAVRSLADLFRQRGAEVLIINTPESPRILGEYRETPYYRGYLDFFRGLAQESPRVHFYDWSAALPAEDFNDWHHPSYIGAIKLGERYADVLGQVLPAGAGERSH